MTEFAMPPISALPSEELDDLEAAFKIINRDDLPISIVGESIFKPFGRDDLKQRPNGIVYPTRRILGNLEENKYKNFTKSNGYIHPTSQLNTASINKDGSISQINLNQLNHCNSAAKTRSNVNVKVKVLDSNFTKALDAKLRKLQKEEKQSCKTKIEGSRKPAFITTVKKGHFLDPPPQVKGPKGEPHILKENKKLYAYSSKPRVLNKSVIDYAHKSRCEAAAKAAAVIASSVIGANQFIQNLKGAISNSSHVLSGDAPVPYANLMYERRVVRGSTYAQHPQPTGEGESAASRAAEARRRALARRKAQKQQIRGAQLRLGSPPPVPGRRHEPVQTDLYLEEIWNNPPVEDVCTQTDLFLDRPVSPFYVPAKTGADVATQIYPGDLFDYDMEVQPILEVLVGKTIEQALIEVLEEEELATLREQQRRFLELRATETAEAQRLEERERRLQAEKLRRMKEYEEGLRCQKEMEERIAGAVLMQGYMADLLPSVLEGLEEEGFLVDNIKQDVDESFMPWLMKEVTQELQEMVSSRDVLTDLVREILENRAELYRALYQEREEGYQEEEEGGDNQDDINLAEHMQLKMELEKNAADATATEEKDK